MKKFVPILFSTLVLTSSAFAQSCDCPAQAKSVRDSYAQAGVVMVGTVQKVGKSALRPGMNEAIFKIMSRYKGLEEVKSNTIYVYTPDSKPKCGISFLVSQDYLVYADGNAARPVSSSCSRTDILDNALGQLEELQKLASKK
jgi:hypothetical protein